MNIGIPTTVSMLRIMLEDVEVTVTRRKWERAALVYAFTEVGGPRNTPSHTPPPPRMNIRTFAAQGFLGLSTPKAVSRYREAWITGIDAGWCVPVGPGSQVELPDEPFPPWPYGQGSTWEDHSTGAIPPRSRLRRPFEVRVLSRLESTVLSLRQLAAMDLGSDDLDPDTRDSLVTNLRAVRDRADEALNAIEGNHSEGHLHDLPA